ncbi:Mne1 protein [Maudiozyma humilis]|uniref:Mne1 protein n=1 Tax=Maudiozyma humilis TaxID=51915 RepID=A0AAV5RSH6_MAUHU|nr:Mne1 protein [Kazachstania humilis]
MSHISKRFVTSGLEKSLYDAFVKETRSLNKSVKLYNPNGVPLPEQQHIHSITDKWVNDAINKKPEAGKPRAVTLQYPLILKTLQQLRTSNNTGLYFRLLKRLTSAKIEWVTTKYEITPKYKQIDGVPIEFYHELANMLYKISMGLKYHRNQTEINALATFTLHVMQGYMKVHTKTNKKHSVKFWGRTIPVLLKTKSGAFHAKILELLDEMNRKKMESKTLIMLRDYTNLTAYTETEQYLNVEDYISQMRKLRQTPKEKESFDQLFQPLFSKILQRYLLCDMIEAYETLVQKILSDFPVTLSEHDISIIDQICERRGLVPLSESLGLPVNDDDCKINALRRSVANGEVTFREFLNKLVKENINPYDKQDANKLDFAIFKVEGDKRTKQESWRKEIPDIKSDLEAANASDEIKKFFLNTLMQNFVSGGYILFNIMLLMEIYSKKDFSIPLSQCEMETSRHSTGYHPLFQMIECNLPTIMTSLDLFYHLLDLHVAGRYNFLPQDFNNLLKTSTRLKDDILFKVYFLHFIRLLGHTFYNKTTGKLTLPKNITWILDDSCPCKINSENIEQLENLYAEGGGEALNDTELTKLGNIFAGDYSKILEISLQEQKELLEHKIEIILKDPLNTPENYSRSEDIRSRRKLSKLLQLCEGGDKK